MMKKLPNYAACFALYVLLFVNSSYGIVIITCPVGEYPEINYDNLASQFFFCKACTANTTPGPTGEYCLICKKDAGGNCIPNEYCAAGEYWTGGACTIVPKGKYTADGKTAWLCPPGMYGDEEGAYMCKLCPAGQYADAMQLQACKKCPAGTFVATTGSEKQADCTTCTGGIVSANQDKCDLCPAGQYYNNGNCVDCPAGKYSDAAGQTECKSCPAGTFVATAGSDDPSKCSTCTGGILSANQDKCDLCLVGQYYNNGNCVDCPAGKYSDVAGQTACSSCPAGTFVSVTGSDDASKCLTCTNGVLSVNQDTCDICPAGTYYQSGVCNDCASGTYSSVAGSAKCDACSNGVVSANRDACLQTEESSESTSSSSNLGVILGAVLGSVGFVALCAFTYFYRAKLMKFFNGKPSKNAKNIPVNSTITPTEVVVSKS